LSQHTTPICKGGFVKIKNEREKNIPLNRIHLEEDAGKSLHDVDPENTSVDYNRAGVPLIEIVTEPALNSGEEAYAFLSELRKLLRYLEICDGNMEEGSMRCDANISIRKKGVTTLGTKVEVKNLNSIRNVKRAIEHETRRMIELVDNGESIIQQTRSFDASNGTTFPLRTKEEANDYRYFADPDLTPFAVTDEMLRNIMGMLPKLPEERVRQYNNELKLSEYDARVITEEKDFSDYFEELIKHTNNYKAAANWMLGPVKSYLNDNNISISGFQIPAPNIAGLISLIDEGKLNFSVASTRIFNFMLANPSVSPGEVARDLNLIQDSDEGNVAAWVDQVLKNMPEKVTEYKKGKKGLIGLFVGEVKKVSNGKADPKLTNEILLKKLQ
jgi:aspartyl-tRNA(Asn)/glutamyl-tRNA(Gln) amidotransferase subunit B